MTDQEINEFLAKEFNLSPRIIVNSDVYYPCNSVDTAAFDLLWSPITNITQALGDAGPGTVHGQMLKKGFRLFFNHGTGNELGSKPQALYWPKDAPKNYAVNWILADTPARAICLAAVETFK